MRRETENLLLLLVGIAVLFITLNGAYLDYVKAGMFGFLLVSGLAVVAVALQAILRDVHRDGRDAAGHHGHSRVPWLLAVPAGVLLLVTPSALGSSVALTGTPLVPAVAAGDAGSRVADYPGDPAAGDTGRMRITDLVTRVAWDTDGSMNGREVRITGFVMRRDDPEHARPDTLGMQLARVVISCCVGDARYVFVELAGMPEAVEDDAWLEVHGIVDTAPDSGSGTTVRVLDFHRVEPPKVRYERGR